MNRYLKLVHYELHRFRMMLLALLAVTLFSQFIGLYFVTNDYLDNMEETRLRETMTYLQYAEKYGPIDFSRFTVVIWFIAPILIGITALLLYVFLIWYRDWLGKNMFIYRLLMLPTSRNHLYLAKGSAIMLLVWALVAFQLLLLPLENAMFNAMVPDELTYDTSMLELILGHEVLSLLVPPTFVDFVLYYAAGALAVSILFTAILLERCFRFKGLIGGILYCAAMVLIFLLPIIISETWYEGYLFPVELLIIETVMGLVLLWVSVRLGFYLLNKKITV